MSGKVWRGRLETAFEINKEQFDRNLEIIKLFRLYTQYDESIGSDVTAKFDEWLQGDCVEFVVERALSTLESLPNCVLENRKDSRVNTMVMDKLSRNNLKVKNTSYHKYTGVSFFNRLKLPYRTWHYGDPNVLRRWQEKLIRVLNVEFQNTEERPLTTISVI